MSEQGDPRYNAVAVAVEAFYPAEGGSIAVGYTPGAGSHWPDGARQTLAEGRPAWGRDNEVVKITIIEFSRWPHRVQFLLKSGHLWTQIVAPGDGWLETNAPEEHDGATSDNDHPEETAEGAGS